MRKYILFTVLACMSVSAHAQLYVEPEKDVDCSVFIPKERRAGSQQGMDIYGGYVFCLEDGGHVNVYDFEKANPEPVYEFELASSCPDNHANNASFGIEVPEGSNFPLLYVSNGKVGSEIEWTCFVEGIIRRNGRMHSELLQTITLDIAGWKDAGYVPIFGAPSWMVDRERGDLWVFSARKRTTGKVTCHAWENQYVATKFRVPTVNEGKKVILGANDILDQVVFPFETWFTQAGCVHDGKIYYCFGVGKLDPLRPSRIRVYDTDTRSIAARYELQEEIPNEMEDLAISDGWLYVNTNTRPGTVPCIWRLSLPERKSEPSGPEEEIRQCPEKAGGIYYVCNMSEERPMDSPDGYSPFYINGFFRHEARHIDDNVTYPMIYEALETAYGTGNLTPFGEAVYDRLEPLKAELMYHEGDLTMRGYRQAVEMGQRMVDNYPEVFQESPYLKANSTNVPRVVSTMHAFVQGVTSRKPHLEWKEVSNSRSFLPKLNPYGTACPGKQDIDTRMHSKTGEWYNKYCSFRNSKINPEDFLARIFKNTDVVKEKYDGYELEWRFWLMASVMQCLDRHVPLWDIFTSDEILAWAEVENYRYYLQKGPDPVNLGRGWGLGSRTLRHILEESAADIIAGRHGVNVNFGHDGTLMALMVNLHAGTWAESADKPEDVFDLWQYWNIPMGANLKFIFYRKDTSDDILVRIVLNGNDVELPFEAVSGKFYDWDMLYGHYIRHCDAVEQSLSETASLKLQ